MRYERGSVDRARRTFDLAQRIAAVALALGLLAGGWLNVSKAWDAWSYHLPFAARLAGIVPSETYVFSHDNQVRFEGFPLLAEAVQGLFWRITGRPEATSLLSLAALFAIPVFLHRTRRVPLHLSFLALVAIPLVQIHATGSYIDLPANACATLLFLCVHRALAKREPPSLRLLVWAAVFAAVTTNMKFQLFPAVVLASIILLVRSVTRFVTPEGVRRAGRGKRLAVFALALPIVFATPIKNVVRHGNPVWPVEMAVLGRSLPHAETAYFSSPAHLQSAPRPVRFLRSVLEIDNRPIASHRRWSVDQWTPRDEPAYRMGGFFGAYVALNLLALGFAAWRRRSREARAAVGLMFAVTVLASVMPQSHELRYYMHWMLLLVALNLTLWAREAPATTGFVAASAVAVVAWSTGGGYLYASGDSFASLVDTKVERAVIESAQPGEHLCIAREPWTFLYAPAFHRGASHIVRESTSDADCAHARRVP
jgi:hypothetical protein